MVSMGVLLEYNVRESNHDDAEPNNLVTPAVALRAVEAVYVNVNERVVAAQSINTLSDIPEGIVKLTFWDENGDWVETAATCEIEPVVPATDVIPSGATFTL
jgi:hypothetical protein